MKTIRTVTRIVTSDEELRRKPNLGVGDYVEVYCGRYEGHCFYVEDIRFNHDTGNFECLYAWAPGPLWYAEGSLALIRRAVPEPVVPSPPEGRNHG